MSTLAAPTLSVRDYQDACLHGVFEAFRRDNRTLVVMPTGCHARGQGILMHDGSIKRVEDIVAGDWLMGPDSTPRRVLRLARGRQEMCRIVPVIGQTWVVNLDHILTLERTPEHWVDVTVREWRTWSKTRRSIHKLVRCPPGESRSRIGFSVERLPEDDYFGFSLTGDGRYLLDDFTVTHNTGKTVLFWSVVQQFLKHSQQRALILAHREELVYQAVAKGRSFGIDCDVEMAASTAAGGLLGDSPVVVASIQTLNAGRECLKCRQRLELALGEWAEENPPAEFPGMALGCEQCLEGRVRRLQKFARSGFGLIVIDEAHHSVASSYQRIIDYFDTPTTKVLGVTATPDRHDEEALGQIYHSVAFEYELPDAISDGWLVPIEQHFVEVEGLDLSNCRKNKDGDMQDKDVSAAMAVLLDEGELHKMVDPTIRLADGRRTLVFAASVAHAEAMCDIFNRHEEGSAEFLHGGTPRELRQATLQRFAKGEIRFLCNCALFLEGFDDPGIECVAVGRPTASRALYSQILGRGTRPLPGVIDGLAGPAERRSAIASSSKPSVLVLDYVGNSGRHKLINTADILGGRESDAVVALAFEITKRCSARGEAVDVQEAIEAAKEHLQQKEEQRRKQAEKNRSQLIAKAKFSTKAVNPFDLFDLTPRREPGWHKGRQPTEKQQAALRKFGVDEQAVRKASFSQASQMLDALFQRRESGRCTLKQAKILQRHRFATDCTFEAASRIIDSIASSGWTLQGNE